jgi:hypothetical protein
MCPLPETVREPALLSIADTALLERPSRCALRMNSHQMVIDLKKVGLLREKVGRPNRG